MKKNFWKKWFLSASSGIFGRILLIIFCLTAGFVGSQYISIPIDKEIIAGAGLFIGCITVFLTIFSPVWLGMIFEWSLEKRKLENENLKLKLELQQQEQESLSDDQDE